MWLKSIKISYSHSLHTHFSCSAAQSCLTLCNPMNCNKPGFLFLHYLPEFAQTHVRWVIMPFNHLILCYSFLLLPSISPCIRVFSSKSALHIRWPNIGASASASVLPMSIQDWSPLGLTGLISLLSKGLWRVFSSTTVRKHQFFKAQPSLWPNSHWVHDYWKDHSFDYTDLCQQSDVFAF